MVKVQHILDVVKLLTRNLHFVYPKFLRQMLSSIVAFGNINLLNIWNLGRRSRDTYNLQIN
jgi:hypothetical protein